MRFFTSLLFASSFGIGLFFSSHGLQVGDWGVISFAMIGSVFVTSCAMFMGHRSETAALRESVHSYLLPIALFFGTLGFGYFLDPMSQLGLQIFATLLFFGYLLMLVGLWRWSLTFDRDYVLGLKVISFGFVFGSIYGAYQILSLFSFQSFLTWIGIVSGMGVFTYFHHLEPTRVKRSVLCTVIAVVVMEIVGVLTLLFSPTFVVGSLIIAMVYGVMLGLLYQFHRGELISKHILEYVGFLIFALAILFTNNYSGVIL